MASFQNGQEQIFFKDFKLVSPCTLKEPQPIHVSLGEIRGPAATHLQPAVERSKLPTLETIKGLPAVSQTGQPGSLRSGQRAGVSVQACSFKTMNEMFSGLNSAVEAVSRIIPYLARPFMCCNRTSAHRRSNVYQVRGLNIISLHIYKSFISQRFR